MLNLNLSCNKDFANLEERLIAGPHSAYQSPLEHRPGGKLGPSDLVCAPIQRELKGLKKCAKRNLMIFHKEK